MLDEIIAARKAKAIEYEEYLKRIAELAKKVEAGQGEDTPEKLDTPGKRALCNNLDQNEELALKIDETSVKVRPDDWRGVQAREQVIKAAIYRCLARCRRGRAHLSHHQGAEGILMAARLNLGGIAVDVVFKDIKNIHLSVYPPTGFQLPTILAPIAAPNPISVRRDRPRHITMFPGGGSLARARYPPNLAILIKY